MAHPSIAGAAITGVVSLLSAYMTCRVSLKQAGQQGAPAPPDEQTLAQGERALEIVKAGVAQHGDADGQADLASCERNPSATRMRSHGS